MLWIELNQQFEKLCEKDTQPLSILGRIWKYCEWCLEYGNQDVQTAAAFGFCEHLLDNAERAEVLPKIMSRSSFLGLRIILEYHNKPDEIEKYINALWK